MAKRKYTEVQKVNLKIEEYFTLCKNDKEPLTVTGLAYHLDMTRAGLLDYVNRGNDDHANQSEIDIANAFKKARTRIEREYDKMLQTKTNIIGLIFTLKNNFGWRDQTYTDVTSNGKPLQAPSIGITSQETPGAIAGLPLSELFTKQRSGDIVKQAQEKK